MAAQSTMPAPRTDRQARADAGPKVTRELRTGRHVLVARCTGRDASSAGYDARLDTLVGEVVDQQP